MCDFFSCISDGRGKMFYFDDELRKSYLSGELKAKNYDFDSHTSIADYFGYVGAEEDTLNKYEYNPLTKEFTIDQLNTTDDSAKIKAKCKKLDFGKIVPELIIKPIINPFEDIQRKRVTKKDIELLKEWVKVRDSVRDSVRNSVRNSVGKSVWKSVINSVWDFIRDSVWNSVGYSVWDSVRNSVGNSVEDSIYSYISTFFNIEYKYDFSSGIKLWERGLIPSFDGTMWRLHGYKGKVLKEFSVEELEG